MSVDFPAPFSPRSTCTSPLFRLKSTSFSATTPGNSLRICFISNTTSGIIYALPTTFLLPHLFHLLLPLRPIYGCSECPQPARCLLILPPHQNKVSPVRGML